ncbi:MAG: GNAT family N-acetyltransferase [Gemmatimonadaceae bacterium]|nr:GNAT family N-acetyltransferase [Gemmatimonadaceae bacterium]
MSVQIRTATANDVADVSAFAKRVFVRAFAADNDPANMAWYVGSAFTPTRQADELRDPRLTYLVAHVSDGTLVAYAVLRADAPDPAVVGEAPIELWRFYVDHTVHGQGVAGQLMSACVEAARTRGAQTLWLGVWEHNPRAIRFYEKCGFIDVGSHLFQMGTDPQTDRVMSRSV